MTKKRFVYVVFTAFFALLVFVGIYIACSGTLFASANKTSAGKAANGDITCAVIDGKSEYLTGSYIDAYGVPASAITKAVSDGGSEEGVNYSQMFDRNFNTAWRSEGSVSDGKTVKLDVFFSDPYEIEGFIYQADRNGKGYFSNLKLSYHDENAVEQSEFVEFGTLVSTSTSNIVHIQFKEKKKMTAIRLEWLEAPKVERSCAAVKELIFLQPKNDDVQNVLDLFDDYAQLTLKSEVNEEKIQNLRGTLELKKAEIASWDSFVDPLLNRASQILANTLSTDPLREMSTDPSARNVLMRVGDVASYCRGVMKFSTFGTNRQATGITVKPSDTLIVYVEADEDDPLPTLVTTQHWGSFRSWISSTYTLYRGRNVIKPQNVYNYSFKDNTGDNIPIGGPVYLINPYIAEEDENANEKAGKRQSDGVKIYFEGGETFPIFRKGDEEETYKSFLKEYADRVEQDKIINAETGSYKVVDVTEIVTDRVFVTVQASMADRLYNMEGFSPEKACENWDYFVDMLLLSEGVVFLEDGETVDSESFKKRLEDVGAQYDSRNEWLNVNIRLMQPFGAAYAANEHIGIQVDWESGAITGGPGFGWGYAHEIGHELDIAERLVGECSNNMVSKFNETVLEKVASRGDFAVNTATLAPDDHIDSYWNTNRGNFTFWWLIESYFPGYWAKLENKYRYENLYQYVENERGGKTINATEKQIYLSSIVTGIDLSYYFERWGYNLSVSDKVFTREGASELFNTMMERAKEQKLIQETDESELPKLWYVDAAEWWARYSGKDKGALYDANSKAPDIKAVTRSGKTYSLMIDEDESYSDPNHLGYEIQVKDKDNEWKVVGFTYGRMFSDTTEYEADFTPTYRLVSYDRALKPTLPGNEFTYSDVAITEVCKLVHGDNETKYNSVSEAVAHAQDGDTIILLKSSFESGIIIDKKLTIKTENSSVTITKSGSDPIFTIVEEIEQVESEVEGEYTQITHTGDLTLQGSSGCELILDGYGIDSDGSLIYVKSGSLNIEHCTLKRGMYKWGNNSAGGALRFDGGTLTVSHTTFSHNSARLGGAVYIIHRENSKITFDDCTFDENHAYEGAGFYNTSTITFTNCIFTNNRADSVGGGFANISGGVLTIKDCTFEGNSAGRGGGFYSDGKVELYGGTFTQNEAETEGAAFAYYRSVNGSRFFYAKKSDTTHNNPQITNNTCEKGSAVWIHGEVVEFVADIENNTCKYALRMGGAKVCIDGGKIKGGFFREGSGTVVVKQLPEVDSGDIPVFSDAEEASYVLFTAESAGVLSQEFAGRFKAENQKEIKYDEARKEIVVDLDSYSVQFSITVGNSEDKSQIKHYRPGYEFTFESFSGDKNQQWYVKEWKDESGKTYEVGTKYKVSGNITFTAVIAQKYKIEFKVEDNIAGVSGQTFYAMPAERYTLPKFDVEGYIHNGWESPDIQDAKTIKLYQPFSVLRAGSNRVFTAKIVRKFTVNYWVTKSGLPDFKFATKTYGYGSKIEGEAYWDDEYIPWGSFIEGFYIKYSNGELSKELVDFETFTISSDLDLVAKVVDDAAIIYYSIYNESDNAFSDLQSDHAEFNSTYSISLLPIPTGYHMTKVNINNTDYSVDAVKGMEFEVTESYYMIFIFIEKDTYTVSFECNETPFRTETMAYGSTYTFTDPTKTLLKEAVRKFEGATKYYFTSYQLVSPNPMADEEGQDENIKVNVMLGDKITITSDVTINIVAYIEGYEYTPQEDTGSELIEGWRADARKRANTIANELIARINDSSLRLEAKERADYVDRIKNELKSTVDSINISTMLTAMNAFVESFKSSIDKIRTSAESDAEKNVAVEQVESARKDALDAFKNMDQRDDNVKEAIEAIEKLANDAVGSIRNATDLGILQSLVDTAKASIKEIIVKYNGDQLLYQKNNAISMMNIASETAKRVVNGLTYLSTQKKAAYVTQIEELLSEATDKINSVSEITIAAKTRSASAVRVIAQQSIEEIRDEFIGRVTTSPAEGETSIPAEARKLNDQKAELAKELDPYVSDVIAAIDERLAEGVAEIKNDGIILSVDEVTSFITSFADEKREYIASLLDGAIASIKEFSEDEEYAAAIGAIVEKTKSDIDEAKADVMTDISKKIEDAEKNSRADLIAINITTVSDAVIARLDELILNDKDTYLSALDKARLTAENSINTAANIGAINAAVKEFNDTIEKEVRLGSEKENANAKIDIAVKDSKSAIGVYGFLGEEWIQTYSGQFDDKAVNAKSDVAKAALSTEMIKIYNTVKAALDEIVGKARTMNAEKGAQFKEAANAELDEATTSKKAMIETLGFLSDDDRAASRAKIDEFSVAAKQQVNDAVAMGDIDNALESFETSSEGALSEARSLNETEAQTKKDETLRKAQAAADALKAKIGALSPLSETSKTLYYNSIDGLLQRLNGQMSEAASQKTIDEYYVAYEQALGTTETAANAENAAKAGDDLAQKRLEALKSLDSDFTTVRESIDKFNFLDEDSKNNFHISLTAQLEQATSAINAAETVEAITSLTEQHRAAVLKIGTDATDQDQAAKTDAINVASESGKATVSEAKTAIQALAYLADKSGYIQRIDAAFAEFDAKLKTVTKPSDIQEASATLNTVVITQRSEAEAANMLNQRKSEAKDYVGEDKEDAREAIEAINALGFLDADGKADFIQSIRDAITVATSAIESASTVDAVSQAVSTYRAAVNSQKNLATQSNSNNENAVKSGAIESIESAKADALNILDTLNFLTAEEKETYSLAVTTLAQNAAQNVFDATGSVAVTDILAQFDSSIAHIKSEAEKGNEEEKAEKTQSAISAAENAGNTLKSELEALGFLANEVEGFKLRIDDKISAAKAAITEAVTVESIELESGKLVEELAAIKSEAEAKNGENADSMKKAAEARLAEKQSDTLGKIAKFTSLTDEEKNGYDNETKDAVSKAITDILNSVDPAAIADAENRLDSTLQAIIARADLNAAENDAVAKANADADEARGNVRKLGLNDELTYINKIDAALSDIIGRMKEAESKEQIAELIGEFSSAIAAITKEAESDAADEDLADAKALQRKQTAEAAEDANTFIDSLKFLSDDERSAYKAEIADKLAQAEQTITESDVSNVNGVATALETELAAITQEANNANTATQAKLKETANSAAVLLKDEAASMVANWEFMEEQDKNDYLSKLQAALVSAQNAIEAATDEAGIQAAAVELNNAIEAARDEAISLNVAAKNEALLEANGSVTTHAESAKNEVNGLLFIISSEYTAKIDAAVETAMAGIEEAADRAAIDVAVNDFVSQTEAIIKEATDANSSARVGAIQAAEDEISEAAKAANEAIDSLSDIDDEEKAAFKGRIETAKLTASEQLPVANSAEELQKTKNAALNEIEQVLTDARSATADALTKAKEAAVSEVEGKIDEAIAKIEAMQYLNDKESYKLRVRQAAQDAISLIDGAADIESAESAKAQAVEAIDTIVSNATNADLVLGAIQKAKESLKALRDAVLGRIKNLGFLRGNVGEIMLAAFDDTTKEALAGQVEEIYQVAITKLDNGEFIDAQAVSAYEVEITNSLNAVEQRAIEINSGNETYIKDSEKAAVEAEKQAALAAVDDCKFLSGDEKEAYKGEIAGAYDKAVSAIESAGTIDEAETSSANFSVDASRAQQNATEANEGKITEKLENARSAMEDMKSQLTELDLTDEQRTAYEGRLSDALSQAEDSIRNAETTDDFDNALELLESTLESVKAEAERDAEENKGPVQVIVAGITAVTKVYDGTASVEFDLENVVYYDAKTGNAIDYEIAALFSLKVEGRLSEYGVGQQIALITNIELTGAGLDSGEYVLALTGHQTFAVAEVSKARLIVGVNERGEVDYKGFAKGEGVGVLTGELRIDYVKNADGTVTATPSGLSSDNYEIVYITSTISKTRSDMIALLAVLIALALLSSIVAVTRYRRRQK